MIDYCTFFTRDLEKEFLPIHFNSLARFCNLDELNIIISIPDNNPDFIDYVNNYSRFKFNLDIVPNFHQEKGPLKTDVFNYASFDCANRMNRFMERTSSDWIIISHLDIVYKSSFMNYFNKYQKDDELGMFGVFQIGQCCVRKKAYDMTHCGFWQVLDVGVSPSGSHVDYLGSRKDIWYRPVDKNIDFLDVSDMLKIQMMGYGWKFLSTETNIPYEHIGQQSGHSLEMDGIPQEHVDFVNGLKQQALQKYNQYLE